MAAIIVPPKWQMPERSITPESIFCARRNFMKTFGLSRFRARRRAPIRLRP